MENLSNFLPLFKVVLAFVCMLAGIRFRIGLGTSILAGAVALGALFGMSPVSWLETAGLALVQDKTIYLSLIVGLILVLSDLMDKTGQTVRLMDSLSGYLRSRRLRLVFFPALIGLLPMPGGAVFSAPMVKSAAKGLSISPERKVLLNYWFRHVWEMAWPLYPGTILTASLANVPIGKVILYMWPGVALNFLLGWFFMLRPGVLPLEGDGDQEPEPERDMGKVLRQGLPYIIAIGGAVGLEGLIAGLGLDFPFELGVCAALALAVICAAVQGGGWKFVASALTKKGLYKMLYVVVAIFVFKDVLQVSGVVESLAGAAGEGVALFAAAVFLPFLVGMVSGISVAFVGAAFPLLIGLLAKLGLGDHLMAYIALGIFSGFVGVMASPIHICFILTCQYFKAELSKVWKRLALPCALLLGCGALYFWFLL